MWVTDCSLVTLGGNYTGTVLLMSVHVDLIPRVIVISKQSRCMTTGLARALIMCNNTKGAM